VEVFKINLNNILISGRSVQYCNAPIQPNNPREKQLSSPTWMS